MKQRIKLLQKLIISKKLDALLVSNSFNIRYLTGFVGSNGTLLVTPKKHVLITDARYFMTAKKVGVPYVDQSQGIRKLIEKFSMIGFEERDMTVARLNAYKKTLPGIRFKGVAGMVESLRLIKDETEVKIIKHAVKIACQSLNQLEKKVKPGMTEGDIEWELLTIARELGADGFSFPPIITFGEDTADIHHQKSNNRLKKGDMILIDSGIIYKGYITDMTRVFFQKKPTDFEQKIYSTVLQANLAAINAIKVGMKLSDLDRVARGVIEVAGYGKYFTHSTGHGTGLEVHEAPTVSTHSTEVVQPGMIFTIEPGIYVEGRGGVRIEDMIYVDLKGGIEVLTTCKKELTMV